MAGLKIRDDVSPEELRKLAKAEHDARVARRLLALANALEGMDRARSAQLAGMDRQTLRDWVIRYNKGGVAGLKDDWRGGAPSRLDEGQQAVLKAMVLRGPDLEKDGVSVWRLVDLCRVVEKRFGVDYGISGMARLLHALDLSWQSARPRHPRSDPAEQEAFKRKFWRTLKRVAEDHPGKRVEVWFQDEARVGQKGSVSRCWFQCGERPCMVRDQGYQSAYIFGAVCPDRDTGVALALPSVCTENMNLFLAELSSQVPTDAHAVVLLDNAGWHVAEELNVPDNMTLVALPPYSPELNSAENIWEYLRRNSWSGRLFESYEAIVEGICAGWKKLVSEVGRIRSIASRKWAAPVKC